MLRSSLPGLVVVLLVSLCLTSTLAQNAPPPPAPDANPQPPAAASFDQVIDRAVEREHFFLAQMKQLHPLVETYLQNLTDDPTLGAPVPSSDVYFLGRLDMSNGTDDRAFSSHTTASLGKRILGEEHRLLPAVVRAVASGQVSVEGRRVHVAATAGLADARLRSL